MMIDLAIKAAICIAFAAIVYKYKALDIGGTLFATFIGAIIIFLQGISWFLLLLVFFITGTVATGYKVNFKKRRLQEKARRKTMNVIANGIVPTIVAIFSIENDFSFLYASAIAVALADTLASELGVLSDKAYFITNFKRAPPGTNGAISLYGEVWALIGSLIIAIFSIPLLHLEPSYALGVVIIGMLGCQIDSVLGATFQGKGKGNIVSSDTLLTNNDVNLISISISTLIAYIVIAI
ncbi:MAG: DUF92 domain-containing protein [Thermoplasmata archaeon]|nr:DUF92 domain-containing protein [Thermoplasmata archaeon]